MDWANEQYILVYIRDTGDWLLWGWETRAVMLFLLRKVDRAGILHLGKGKLRALAKIIEMPEDILAGALKPLLDDGCVQIREDKLVIPNFIPAQETPHTDKVRKQMSRERARAHVLSQSVTTGHAKSHEVTLASKTSKTNLASESDARASEVIPEEEPEEQTGVRHVSSRPPPPPANDDRSKNQPFPESSVGTCSNQCDRLRERAPEPSEAAAPELATPPNRSEDAAPGNLGRAGAVASGDLASYIRGKPKLADLDVDDLADFARRMHDPGNVPLGMIREAIDDANDKSERGEARHIRHARVIGFIKQAKMKPRKPDPKPPAHVDNDDPELIARIRRGPKPLRFNDPRAAAVVAKLGVGPSGAQAPPGPTSELELADKARQDRERLAEDDAAREAARKAAG